MATAAVDKAQDKSKEKHKRFRSDRYSKMLERQRLLRECETVSALAKAEAILKAEKEYLMKHGVRVNWPGKKALEEAYKQSQQYDTNSSSFPLSISSTSISYSSNIHVDPKLTAYGGSLPASPRHTPLQKAPAIAASHYEMPPMGRISLASASPIRGNPLPSDNSFNFSFNENSSIFAQNPQLTSTPVGKPQQQQPFSFQPTSASSIPVSEPKTITTKPFIGFAPSASNSTDSGKFSSDNATDAELSKTPQSEKPFAGFGSTAPLFPQSSTTTVTSLPASTMPSVKEFIDNPENNEIRRMIKMEVGNSIDKAIQKRPTEVELNKVLAEFSQYFNRLLAGESMKSTLSLNKTFIFDSKNEKMMNFLIDICSRRIIEMLKQDPSLSDVAKLVHSLIGCKILNFKKIFRQILTNSMFIIQLTSDDLIIALDEKLNDDAGFFTLNCLDTDRALLRFLCIIEMVNSQQVKNLSDLCGIRLLNELCIACNTLPQLPVTTLSVLFEIMQTAGPALTHETSPYRKEFIQMVFPRLRSLVNEDMKLLEAACDGIAVRLAEQTIFGTHLQKMHAIVRQRVVDSLEKIGIKS
uniref:Uncharacterized protein n=1 Tax=Panagrolaimus sp. PS1159 TaxID=55785 RepID=A0AC35GHV8_9BILA